MCNGDAWGPRHTQTCASCNVCGIFGADFGIMGSTGVSGGHGQCQCKSADWIADRIAPLLEKLMYTSTQKHGVVVLVTQIGLAGGGATGTSSYCGNWAKCCAGGNMGGSGIVKITFRIGKIKWQHTQVIKKYKMIV